MEEEDLYVLPAWEVESSHTHDFLDDVFPSDEAIIEAMSGVECNIPDPPTDEEDATQPLTSGLTAP